MDLAERLRSFRAARELSQAELATLVGVKPITVLRWENGTSKPTPSVAEKLETLGFGEIAQSETKHVSIPRITLYSEERTNLREDIRSHLTLNSGEYTFTPSSYVINGPENQLPFFETLYQLQENLSHFCSNIEYARRLSLVSFIPSLAVTTAQHELESPKPTSKHWDPNYGSHGWHRYIGRFPPQLVRALLNHFGVRRGETICDPFAGSGTTLVESRLIGMRAVGMEVCPLSSLISRTKSKFPISTATLENTWTSLTNFYRERWDSFVAGRDVLTIPHKEILQRNNNPIQAFPNHEKWMTPEALLGTSIVVEFARTLKDYTQDALCCALSACMRSIGNLDVDVVRAEYSKAPRGSVNVLKLVQRTLQKMITDINRMMRTHKDLISSPGDIQLIEGSLLEAEIPAESIDHIITSPPYGVESVSYLRTHLLSYRCLQSILNYDPYSFDENIIGSEYVKDTNSTEPTWDAANYSKSFVRFFKLGLSNDAPKRIVQRRNMMVHFFDDMVKVARQFHTWLRPTGQVAFVIGNKRLGEKIIPTDIIVSEIFDAFGLRLDQSISHKLKCNNSNSEVPWQERIIQDEFILLFTKVSK